MTSTTTTTTTTSTTYGRPMVPPLFFEEHEISSASPNNNHNSTNNHCLPPPELLTKCADYFDWGDLAKLACVQSSWKDIIMDTANTSQSSKWELAQALLEGACGLEPNPVRAVHLLQELAHVPIDETTGQPPRNVVVAAVKDDDDDEMPTQTIVCCFTPAMRRLADCYLEGIGVECHAGTALAWLEASFTMGGDAEAAHEVALIQEYGRHGIQVDVVQAAQWFEKAAQAGHVDSMAELGLCYELGCGVEQSDEEALDWYTKAANLGHATAKYSVGEAFEEARGVPQSDQEACLWYYRAALIGDEDSKRALRRLYDIARIVVPGVAAVLRE